MAHFFLKKGENIHKGRDNICYLTDSENRHAQRT